MNRGIAVLCPGPSLIDVWCEDFFADFHTVIAVNTVAHHYRSHWLAAADRHVLEPVLLLERGNLPLRGFITHSGFGPRAYTHGLLWSRLPLQEDGTTRVCCPNACEALSETRCGYTFPNAIYAAILCRTAKLGEIPPVNSGIEIFGFDCSDTADFSGVDGDHSRNRWRMELIWLRDIWDPAIKIHGQASQAVRDYLTGKSNVNPFE